MTHTYLLGRVRQPLENPNQLARELDWFFAQLCERNPSAAIVELTVATNGNVMGTCTYPESSAISKDAR